MKKYFIRFKFTAKVHNGSKDWSTNESEFYLKLFPWELWGKNQIQLRMFFEAACRKRLLVIADFEPYLNEILNISKL